MMNGRKYKVRTHRRRIQVAQERNIGREAWDAISRFFGRTTKAEGEFHSKYKGSLKSLGERTKAKREERRKAREEAERKAKEKANAQIIPN